MLKRIAYTLTMAWKYRHHLAKIVNDQQLSMPTLAVQIADLKTKNKALVLDFDGVLAAHGSIQALPDIERWLDQCVITWGTKNIFILSNKPMPERIHYFQKRFTGIRFISGVAKKPYPDGLIFIAQTYGFKPQDLVLLDDRLLTGMLATCIAGTQAIYIYPAYCNFKQNPIKESFFASLRWLERQIMRYF